MRTLLLTVFYLTFLIGVYGQTTPALEDTLTRRGLDTVFVTTYFKNTAPKYLADVIGINLFSGKKTNQVYFDASRYNLAQNITRTAFAQIPGLTMWDMDGGGLQINIGSRGTDSHRSIEMNMRQNSYNINSEMFGYPEDHYTPPLQAIKQVQLVRGSAALQFGSQFGGMMNYIMKEADSTKPLLYVGEQTTGLNNFFNSFNSLSGTKGKISYYAYYDYRHSDGWRANAAFNYHAYYANLTYKFNLRSSLSLQFSRMDYVQKIAGGLSDLQFGQNARQSFRSRNWFNPEINIPALTFKHAISANTRIEITANALFGQRNSVQFIAAPAIMDTFNTAIKTYNPRQIDRDYYSSVTAEARLLHTYNLEGVSSTLATGIRASTETTKRRQKGVGTTDSNFDLSLVKPYGTDLHFSTKNFAAFAENIFQLTKQLSITPGVRYEMIKTILTGKSSNALYDVAYKGDRNFPLFGTGVQYQLNNSSQLYANISQAYRPFLYANITPADRVDMVDPDLKDSRGYDIDLGYRGHYSDILNFDVNAFYLFYGNRVGLISQKKPDNSTYLFTTNVGDALTKGAELYVELSLLKSITKRNTRDDIRIFNSLSYNYARYLDANVNKGGATINLKGNMVENIPEWMTRTGLTMQHNSFSTTFQFSYTGKCFNDAFNTVSSNDGITGIVPSYHLWDWSVNYNFSNQLHLSGGVNNFTNEKYFNRRITMYPGPGILSADGRSFYVTVTVRL